MSFGRLEGFWIFSADAARAGVNDWNKPDYEATTKSRDQQRLLERAP